MIAEPALQELKNRNPVHKIAARWVHLRWVGTKMVGPCPVCSKDRQSKAAARFEATAEAWVCAVCCDGGDVIKLMMKVEGLDFLCAVAWLGGPGEVDPAAAERRERDPTLVRHIYDLHVIRDHYDAADVALLAREIMLADAGTYGHQFPAYRDNPLAETLRAGAIWCTARGRILRRQSRR